MLENMFNIAEVTELMYNAKFANLLEGHNYPTISELWFFARN